MHEYSVIGHSRASVGRYLGMVAGLLASLVAILLTLALKLAERLGFLEGTARVIIFPLNAAAFYLLGHLAFEKWIWKRKIFQALLGIPDLNGEWNCIGETKDENGNVTFQLECNGKYHPDMGKDLGVPQYRSIKLTKQVGVSHQRAWTWPCAHV